MEIEVNEASLPVEEASLQVKEVNEVKDEEGTEASPKVNDVKGVEGERAAGTADYEEAARLGSLHPTGFAGEETAEVTEVAPQEAAEAAVAEAGIPAAEVERLVEEAYRRGRNESIAELMARPGMFQPGAPRPNPGASTTEGFLANRRPSIWDV